MNAIMGAQQSHTHLQLKVGRLTLDRIFNAWMEVRAHDVKLKQPDIVFGDCTEWADVEADEVSFAKHRHPSDAKKVVRDAFLGMEERGKPWTLVIVPLEPRITTARAPGPGPLRLEEWKKIGPKWLKDQKVILHTDGAKAYRLIIRHANHKFRNPN